MPDRRRYSPSSERNREPILDALRRLLPERGVVLEVASGTGQHGAHFAAALPELRWQPTEANEDALESIRGWQSELPNAAAPLRLDARADVWPVEGADAVFCANMIHIAPWPVTVGLFQGASRVLAAGAALITYGPYRVHGAHTADSNAAFDRSLRARDASWGVRDIQALEELAEQTDFELDEQVPMPANNFLLCFRRRA